MLARRHIELTNEREGRSGVRSGCVLRRASIEGRGRRGIMSVTCFPLDLQYRGGLYARYPVSHVGNELTGRLSLWDTQGPAGRWSGVWF